MCGICGAVVLGARSAEVAPGAGVERMNATLVRRGPDSAGSFADGPVAMAMRRLAIIDLATGGQPVSDESGRVVAVCNGEIYNYRELREGLLARGHRLRGAGDVETIVHLYEERGLAFTDELDGMFAIALWDSARRRLVLARDRLGIKPLYHARVGDVLLFASELKALLAWPGFPREVDPVALSQYLRHEYVPAPRSILRAARRLRPGHQLVVDAEAGTVEERPWWRLGLVPDPALRRATEADLAAELWEEIRAAVRREMVSDVPLGVFLSGGIDSSAVTAAMVEVAGADVRSFSIGFREPSFDESPAARRVARALGSTHAERVLEASRLVDVVPRVVDFMDEPLADASIVPTHVLSCFAREHVKVALGGDGGDELFGGYPTLKAHRLAAWYRRVPRLVRDRLVRPIVERLPVSDRHASFEFLARRFVRGADFPLEERHHLWLGGFAPEEIDAVLLPELRQERRAATAGDALAEHALACAGLGEIERAMYLDMKMYLEGDILPKVDRASMAASLEVRVPLLNRSVVSLACRLPLEHKLRGLTGKSLLRKALRGRVPREVLARPKHGFGVPVAAWLRGELRPALLDLLAPERLARQGLFDPDPVQALVREHLLGTRDHRKRLWPLLVYQLWHERWMR
jgi:asparagine synthase (glutamine-hydrolysing)